MKQHKNRRIVMSMYAAAVSMVILTGFTSLAAEADTKVRRPESVKEESAEWNFSDIAGGSSRIFWRRRRHQLRKRSRLMKRSWRKSGKPQRKRRGSRLRRRLLRRPHRPTGNFLHL